VEERPRTGTTCDVSHSSSSSTRCIDGRISRLLSMYGVTHARALGRIKRIQTCVWYKHPISGSSQRNVARDLAKARCSQNTVMGLCDDHQPRVLQRSGLRLRQLESGGWTTSLVRLTAIFSGAYITHLRLTCSVVADIGLLVSVSRLISESGL
jgi:hypothetical protein